MKKAVLDVEMKIKNTCIKKNNSSIDNKFEIDFLENYELDMYNIEIKTHKPPQTNFTRKKSLYKNVKEKAIPWFITSSIVITDQYSVE